MKLLNLIFFTATPHGMFSKLTIKQWLRVVVRRSILCQ